MKFEITLSYRLFQNLKRAAKNLDISVEKAAVKAIRRFAAAHKHSDEELAERIANFYKENPDLCSIEAQREWSV